MKWSLLNAMYAATCALRLRRDEYVSPDVLVFVHQVRAAADALIAQENSKNATSKG